MDLKFRVAARVAKPVHEVFEAVADPEQIVELFHDRRGQGPARNRRDRNMGFRRLPGRVPGRGGRGRAGPENRPQMESQRGRSAQSVRRRKGRPRRRLQDDRDHDLLTARGDSRTLVEIAEEGWRETAGGLKASYGNCQGWAQMHARSRRGSSTASTSARGCTNKAALTRRPARNAGRDQLRRQLRTLCAPEVADARGMVVSVTTSPTSLTRRWNTAPISVGSSDDWTKWVTIDVAWSNS